MSEFEELERPAEKNKGGRPPKVKPEIEKAESGSVESKDNDIALLVSENEKLKAENEAMKEYVNTTMAGFQAKLDKLSGKEPVVNNGDELDEARPYSKTRNITGGLFYEQDGKQFDGAKRLKK